MARSLGTFQEGVQSVNATKMRPDDKQARKAVTDLETRFNSTPLDHKNGKHSRDANSGRKIPVRPVLSIGPAMLHLLSYALVKKDGGQAKSMRATGPSL